MTAKLHFVKSILLVLIVVCFFICSCGTQHSLYSSDSQYHQTLDKEYKDSISSPLYQKDREVFTGHDFFPIDKKYIVKASLIESKDRDTVSMPTASGNQKEYIPKYTAIFKIDGREQKLKIYTSIALSNKEGFEKYLFLPFRDLTNNESTYGGGRYLDLKDTGKDHIWIDFNRAYNPYCAYSEEYNCPIVPIENTINEKIEAGIKLEGGHFLYHK